MNSCHVKQGSNAMNIDSLIKLMCPLTLGLFISFFVLLFSLMRLFFIALKTHSIKAGKWQKTIMTFSFLTMVVFFIVSNYIESKLRDKISYVVSKNFTHDVNGMSIEGNEHFRKQWLSLSRFKLRAGSGPTSSISVKLRSGGDEISLILYRDSREGDFYWVSYADGSCLSEIGFVRLDFLGDF